VQKSFTMFTRIHIENILLRPQKTVPWIVGTVAPEDSYPPLAVFHSSPFWPMSTGPKCFSLGKVGTWLPLPTG
jgi:hypothetical protein